MKSNFFTDAWKGKPKLAEIFWIYYVIGGCGIALLTGFLGLSLGHIPVYWLGSILAFVILGVYLIWVLGALWACAFNVKWKGWGYLTRGLVVFSALQIVYELVLWLWSV